MRIPKITQVQTTDRSSDASSLQLLNFYQFRGGQQPQRLRAQLRQFARLDELRGTILLAAEGVNVAIAGPVSVSERLFAFLCALADLDAPIVNRISIHDLPFRKLKIKCKKEIITLRAKTVKTPPVRPLTSNSDNDSTMLKIRSLNPQEWNELLRNNNPILLDVRNDFEHAMGSFVGAINPRTQAFSEILPFIAKHLDQLRVAPVAIFCTGGIRCDKLIPHLAEQGIKEIYQLQGGITRYLRQTPPGASLWEGDCFVFDDRICINNARAKQ